MKKTVNIIFSLLVLTSGCFLPELGEEDVYRLKDNVPPEITLYAPEDNGPYGNSIMLQGRAVDFADAGQTINGKVISVTAEITGEANSYNIEHEADGTFSQIINTNDYSGTVELKIRARDWNGMETVVIRTLKSSPFASFSAHSGNKYITLSWNPVPLADSYNIYYTDDGSIPSETNGKRTSTTATTLDIDDLKNGVLYSFVIDTVSHDPLIMSTRSHVIKAVPLSTLTLYPSIIAYHDMLDVRWNRLPGIDKYNVYRREELSENWVQVGGDIAANYYADMDVRPGICYYYRIAPAIINSIRSEPAAGSPAPLKPFFYNLGSRSGLAGGDHLVMHDNFCYATGVWGGVTGIHCFNVLNPEVPDYVSSLPFSSAVRKMIVAADRLIVLTETTLYSIDISLPAALPEPVTLCQATIFYKDIACSGSRIYVLEEGTGIAVIDMSVFSPEPAPFVTTDAFIDKIVAADGKLYYIAYTFDPDLFFPDTSALKVMDLSTSSTDSYDLYDAFDGIWVIASVEAVNGNDLVVGISDDIGGGTQLYIVDIDEFPGFFLEGLPQSNAVLQGVNAIQIYRNYLYITSSDKTIIYNRLMNRQIEYKQLPSGIKSITFYKDYIIACRTGMDNLNTYYIRVPFDAKQPLQEYDIKAEGLAMKIEGSRLFVVYDEGINSWQMSNPAGISSSRQFHLTDKIDPACPVNIKIQGKYLFLSNKADFYVFNTDLDSSYPVSRFIINRGIITSLELHGDYAYLACGEGGAAILDMADPEDLHLFYSLKEFTPVLRSFLIDNYLYYICPTQILIQDASYLPITRLVSNPPIYMTINRIIDSVLYYPQLFVLYDEPGVRGFLIVSCSMILSNFPRMQEKNYQLADSTPPDHFLFSGTYAFAYNKGTNYIFDFSNLDNLNYTGTLPYPFTVCDMNKDKLVLYNSVNGKLKFLDYGGDL